MADRALRLGVLRLLDCTPALVAGATGAFAREGVDVEIRIEASWANIADRLAFGQLDGAVMPGPLALAMMLGLRGRRVALRAAALVSREGNAVVLAPELAATSALAPALAASRRPARFAAVHAWSSHDLLLRTFLHRRGLTPEGFEMIVLPPAEMTAALARREIAGFCVGAPWGALAALRGLGAVVADSAELAPLHPEKFLMLRAAPAVRPGIAPALRRALGAAAAECRAAFGGPAAALAALLELDAPELERSLAGGFHLPRFETGAGLVPGEADLLWPLEAMRRHGLLETVGAAAITRTAEELTGDTSG